MNKVQNPASDNNPDHHHDQSHAHQHHDHTHGVIDPSIVSTERGLWAVKWSFLGLMVTALLQVVVVFLSSSVALLADTIHNFADASTAIPLGIAFLLTRRKPSTRFTYGLGKTEDVAGVIIVALIFFSAIVAGYESFQRLLHPQTITYLWAVVAASIIGFIGNEAVAIFRIRIGREINSAALIADGNHARIDGWTSLAVLGGALGVWMGYPIIDPLIGLGITVTILKIVWESAQIVFTRLLDGIEPQMLAQIQHTVEHVEGILWIEEIHARWLGRQLYAEINVALSSGLSVDEGHAIASEIRHQLSHQVTALRNVTIEFTPYPISK